MIKKNNAFLLISYPYKTTSLINHFLTDEAIIQTLSYGAKKDSKNFGSDLNSISKLDILYYQNSSKNLNTLKETSIIKNYGDIERNNYSLFATYYIRELILNIAKDFDERYFILMEKMLDVLSDNINKNASNENTLKEYIKLLLRSFEIKVLYVAGISPQLSNCLYCGHNNFDNYIFSVYESSIVCNNCKNNLLSVSDTYKLDKESIEFFKIIKYKSLSDILKIDAMSYSRMSNYIGHEILSKLLFNHSGKILKSSDLLEEVLST